MKIWNMTVSQNEAGGKLLNLQIHGVIDGGWLDDQSTSTAEIAQALAEHQDAAEIETHINSVGGSLFGGVAVYNMLEAHPAKVTSYVDGLAASAASIIAMAGKTVMGRGSMLMIHNPLAVTVGDAAEHRQTAAMLDKARDSLISVYKAKTGKDGSELKAMLDAETWLGPDQALRQGFANEVVGEDAPEPAVEDLGDLVAFRGEPFPRATMPPQILAMAKPRTPPAPAIQTPPGGGNPEPEAVNVTITREILAEKAPDLLKALLEEGHGEGAKLGYADGVKAERARLQAIDELGVKGCADLVAAAKYGEKPSSAAELAVAAIKAGQQAGLDLLEARKREAEAAAKVRQAPPTNSTEEAELLAAKNIAEHANRRHGGVR